MTQEDPIQAQLIAARRNQILNAAVQVFAEKGFHSATIRDVAKAAGVADGTIYNYFDNKTALLLGILDRLNETAQRASAFAQATHMDIRDWLQSYITHRYETFDTEANQVFQVLLAEILVNKELRDQYFSQIIAPTFKIGEKSFEEWKALGIVKSLDTTLTMRVIAGMAFGLLILRLMGDEELAAQWDQLPDIMTELILNGLLKGDTHE